MSLRLQAKSRLLIRFVLSHRVLFITLVAMVALTGVGISNSSAVKSTLSVLSGNSGSERVGSTKTTVGAITVHAAGRGKPFLNLKDGRGMSVNYSGDRKSIAALQGGAAQARSLASADFDRNGTPDVVAGFASNGAGMITLQRGNPDAFAPADDSVFVRMQQGYDPASLLPGADVYAVPASPDFLVTGNFTKDTEKDVLFAAKGGALYLMQGNGTGRLDSPLQIDLPGPVTALGVGEFRAADGFTDVAVGVSGSDGDSLLIFDGADGFSEPLAQFQLAEPATGIELGGLDDDSYMDVAVSAGSEIVVVHGWGRKERVTAESREERINVGAGVQGIALGQFTWDREGRSELAALTSDGAVQVVQSAKLDSRPFTEEEAAQRNRGKLQSQSGSRTPDVESMPSWRPGKAKGWANGSKFLTSSAGLSSTSAKPLLRAKLSYRETDDLMVMGGGKQSRLEIMRSITPVERDLGEVSAAFNSDGLTKTTLDADSAPVAVLVLPRKLNGVTDVVMLNASSTEPVFVPNAPNTTITVDRTDDPNGGALAAASACTAVGNDCSLRGALQFANNGANNNTTISLPAGTYILSTNGTSAGGCDGNTVGDLGANQTMSITGAGAATTIIRQTGTGPANDGDRVMCMDEPFTLDLVFNFSGFTMVGGRDGTAAGTGTAIGGGGIIGGEKGNVLTMTNVVLANNQVTVLGSGNIGGGGIQWTGGDLNITNCTIGGTAAPGAYTDRTSTNTGNLQAGSGGGVMFTPSAPQHTASTGVLTVAGSTFSRNTAASLSAGGGGLDVLIFAFASPGGIGTGTANVGTSTFQNNQALSTASGGGIIVESIATTVATTSFTNNSALNRGGGIFVGGASLLLNGTTPSITFTGNTATNGGSSVSTSAAVTVSGTNTTIGGDIEINTLGTWTNNTGSTLAPTNVVVTGGTFNMNNSTMNVSGDLTIGPGPIVGSTFNGNSGTVNIQGNFVLNAGGSPSTTLNAGTSTFNFNGTSAQSISNGTSITFFNLTDSNTTNPLTLNNSLAVNNTLNVNGLNAILSPVAGAVISGTGTLTGTGTARASRIAGTPDFLNQYTITNKTLTNLTIDYNGTTNQTVNNTPAYSDLRISGSGIKTLQGSTVITSDLNIAAANLTANNNNFALGGNWTNGVGAGGFTPGTGTVTFQGSTGTQTLSGNTTFNNLTLNNSGATTNFSNTTTTIGNDLVATAGTMDGGTSTIIFTGTDGTGAIDGAQTKNFHNLQINSPAVISHTTGGNIVIEGNYSNAGTFNQAAGLSTIFDLDNTADGAHALSGAGTTTFGNFTINASNAIDAGSHNFSVIGANFQAIGTFTGNTSTVSFTGGIPQSISGDALKNFSGLVINNANGVTVANGGSAVDAIVSGILTLNTDLSVASGAILQQGGTSAGAADVLGTVRRIDLGVTPRSFGHVNNQVTINSGPAPTILDFNLAKVTPTGFPAGVRVVPRTYNLTPVGGVGMSATLRLRYIDPTELNVPGINESRFVLWKDTTGSDNWQPQGGTPDPANNFVTHSGITSFSEWAIAEASDLTLSKANNVGGSAVVGQSWNWTLTAANTGSPATFTAGQTIITDNLPNSNLNYGAVTVQNVQNITGSANISCSIVSNDLTCTANGGNVTFASDAGTSSFDVVFSATPQAAGSYQNPRTGGGIAQIDPNNNIVESNESNNSPANNTVTVGKANTTTTINSDNPDPSVVGQPVTVTWSVAVSAPGALGAALTGNVTVSDGTNQCVAAVSAGQCDITFTSAGAKNLTATYAGDSNYNGSASTPATPHTVNKADTTTTITSDLPDPSTPGQSVTVQWTVTVNSPGAGTPTGNVNVTVSGGAETCSAAVSAGQCSLVLNTTGQRTITATYVGDTNFNTSSDTEDHSVCGDGLVTTIADSGAGSLRQAIANACDGTTITFDTAGVFSTPQTILLTSAEIIIDKNITIDGTGAQVTVSGNNAHRSFTINSGKTVNIKGLTFTGGNETADAGGAIKNLGGTLTMTSCNVYGNTAGIAGGISSQGSLTLINCNIGGPLAGQPNTATLNSGGGIQNVNGTLTVINSTIANNAATTGGGGGISNEINGVVNIVNSTISGNTAIQSGGGINSGAAVTIINSTISGNKSNLNGGGINTVDPAASLTLINVTITDNRADFENNSTGAGGGIATFNTTTTLHNTIVAGNFRSASTRDDVDGTVTGASSFNLIGDGNGLVGITNGSNGNQIGTTGSPIDPLLGVLANNGGTTMTHALLAGSPAIEAGSNANLPVDTFDLDGDANTAETLPVDQRGFVSAVIFFPRVADSADANVIQTVDIGAFELHPSVEDIIDQSTDEDTPKNVTFNLGDDTGSLISSVTATSSNTTLVPNANLGFTGSNGSRTLQITPAAGLSGTTTITITVTATNGQTAVDTFVLTVGAVNDPPSGADNTVTTPEDTAYTFTVADFGFSDPGDTPPNTLLAVKITTLPGLGTLTNNNVAVNANDFIPVGDITGGLLKFTPVANEFGTPYTSFTFQVQDNGGGTDLDPTPNTMTINVTAVNDPPSFTIAGDPPAVAQDAGPQTVLNFATNISQGPNETGQILTFNITPGVTTGTLTFSTPPAINATTGTLTYTATNGTSGTATFSVTLSDNGGGTDTSAPQQFTITVIPPNASPVVTTTAGNLAYTENAGAVAIDPGLTVTDSDDANLTGATIAITAGFVSAQDTLAFTNQLGITGNYNAGTGVLTLTGTTTVANYQTALRTVTYQNGSDDPTASRTITFTATDGVSLPGSATRGITITAVNDGPVNTVPGPQNTNEDTAKVFSSGNGNQISVADPDLGANPIKITLTATNGTLTLSTVVGLTITTGDGTDDPTIVFTGSLASANTALNGLSFDPTADFNGPASLQIISDDQGATGTGGALTDTDTINITVNAANDAPVVTTTAGNLSYTENDLPTAIDTGLTITDVDNPNLVGATVAITGNFANGQDVLAFTNQLGITGNYNAGTGVLTLTGTTTVANYQTALRSVTYANSSENPSTSARTVTFTVNDGTNTGSATRGIIVTAVNDGPVNTVPGAQGTAQNTPIVFSTGNSNLIAVTDPDAGTNVIQVTLTATNGTLTLSGTTGLSFVFSDGNGTGAGDGTADPTMTFRGTLANVNAALNGMTFTPTAGFTGPADLTITSNDLGNSGTGGPLTDTDTINIQVALEVSITDSQLLEPTSGSANMIFSVALNAPAPAGGASVSFTTQQQSLPDPTHATAGQDYTTTSGVLNFAQGEQIKLIFVPVLSDNPANSEINETFLVNLSTPVNLTIVHGTATGTILASTTLAGPILISELRTSGPAGAGDDFVEIYNNTDTEHIVDDASGIMDAAHGYGLYKMGADCNATPVLIGVIPNGTAIPARGHYLFVGSAYSLGNYGGSGNANGDQVMTEDIENDRNVALFSTASLLELSIPRRLDAVGFGANTGAVCDLLREGTTATPASGSVLEYSYFRDECGKKGNPATFGPCPSAAFTVDTGVNGDDFTFADTAATATPAGQRLGAPGPQNLGAPRLMNVAIPALPLDSSVGLPASPNRVRDKDDIINAPQGTMLIRRRFVNNTGAPITRLRFRIIDFSTFPLGPGDTADLRALNSIDALVTVNDSATCAAKSPAEPAPCTVQVFGTTLEQPPTQALGGGLNSSFGVGTISLPTPLAPGQSVNLHFLLGVHKTGSFKFFFNIEALTQAP